MNIERNTRTCEEIEKKTCCRLELAYKVVETL